jgi:maltooligosyltrehalose trehalohydrolase
VRGHNVGCSGRPWTGVVFYEVHPSVAASFGGEQEDLPRLKQLGVTAIQLMPFNNFHGGRNRNDNGLLRYAPESTCYTPASRSKLLTSHAAQS